MIPRRKSGKLTTADRDDIAIFQKERDLKVDGVPGHQTWNYIRDELEGQYHRTTPNVFPKPRKPNSAPLTGVILMISAVAYVLGIITAGLL